MLLWTCGLDFFGHDCSAPGVEVISICGRVCVCVCGGGGGGGGGWGVVSAGLSPGKIAEKNRKKRGEKRGIIWHNSR